MILKKRISKTVICDLWFLSFKNCQTVNCQNLKFAGENTGMPSITCANAFYTSFQCLLYPHRKHSFTPITGITIKHRRHSFVFGGGAARQMPGGRNAGITPRRKVTAFSLKGLSHLNLILSQMLQKIWIKALLIKKNCPLSQWQEA